MFNELRHRRLHRLLLLFGLVGLLLPVVAWAAPASARNANPGRVLPPNSSAYGKTYGAWSAAWWQYVLAQPTDANPLLDTTGADCRTGQSGEVFFLVGAFEKVVRNECTVPAGKALFFPLVNEIDFHVSCSVVPASCDDQDTPQKIWTDLQNGHFSASALHATIDGIPVQNLDPVNTPYRACAGPVAECSGGSFSFSMPTGNLFGFPASTYGPAVADGIYLLLAPLPPGTHTITFGGTSTFFGSTNTEDITYDLFVSSP